jgi:D-amino peptidase
MAGTGAGMLNHTFSSVQVYNLSLNGEKIGETGMNSLVAGHFGVPVVMVSGDDKLCSEARAFLGNVETAMVKESIDRYVARCLTPSRTTQLIKDAARKSVGNISNYKPITIDPPYKMEIQFTRTSKAAAAAMVPTVERKDSRTVAFTCDSIIDAYNLITVCLLVAKRDERE